MQQPFIRNHQFNLIKKQIRLLQQTCQTVYDPKIVKSVRENAQLRIAEAFPEAAELQIGILEQFLPHNTEEQFQDYLRSLEPYLNEFPRATEAQLKKLFPKIKKLKLPDLSAVDYRHVTYLGWTDIASNKMFLVYPLSGTLAGVEGRFTPANKKSTCFLCKKQAEVALFTAVTKSKPANASPDYYKAIGNYLCLDSETCNKNMTELETLERFIADIVGR
ncbi:FusB/FusC family EF-G-binding protein [Cohnella sp. AR92]|uniref:FusB/FusC family EF-G-binding protein n=1 Tax=Cohnella sp. AR92 TaxID=648716 RepID=UPI000F8CF419|nr:FusB/FusC family EF-G-binding protein [Cohnella sp. AR92]RUS42074.1 elongation factor G-binding protein [Cohnella sp. AR92]